MVGSKRPLTSYPTWYRENLYTNQMLVCTNCRANCQTNADNVVQDCINIFIHSWWIKCYGTLSILSCPVKPRKAIVDPLAILMMFTGAFLWCTLRNRGVSNNMMSLNVQNPLRVEFSESCSIHDGIFKVSECCPNQRSIRVPIYYLCTIPFIIANGVILVIGWTYQGTWFIVKWYAH